MNWNARRASIAQHLIQKILLSSGYCFVHYGTLCIHVVVRNLLSLANLLLSLNTIRISVLVFVLLAASPSVFLPLVMKRGLDYCFEICGVLVAGSRTEISSLNIC